jgi:hypothetical protein
MSALVFIMGLLLLAIALVIIAALFCGESGP